MSRTSIDPVLREAVREELVRLVGHPTVRGRATDAASRRWMPIVTSIVVAAVVVAVGLYALQNRTPHPATTPATPRPTASATKATTEGVLSTSLGPVVLAGHPLSTGTETVAGSSDSALYVATARSDDDTTHFTLQRIDVRTGATTRRSITLDYLHAITVGPDGVYLSTSVIERFQHIPDTVLRLDPDTLRTRATRHFPATAVWGGDVQLAAQGQSLVATRGDGSVETLDPETLAVKHSVTLLDHDDLTAGLSLSAPVISAGEVWVLGADHGRRLVALDPSDLRRTVQTGVLDRDRYGSIAAAPGGVYLAGTGLASVDATGAVRRLAELSSLAVLAADTAGADALLVADPAGIDRYSIEGKHLAHVALDPSDGQVLAASSQLVWVLGLPGAPAGISAIATPTTN